MLTPRKTPKFLAPAVIGTTLGTAPYLFQLGNRYLQQRGSQLLGQMQYEYGSGRSPATRAGGIVRSARSSLGTAQKQARANIVRAARMKTKNVTNSKSSGFLSKGTKRWKKKKLVKYAKKGTNLTTEGYKVVEATDCAWVGHSTVAALTMLRQAVKTMFAYFLRCVGSGDVDDVNQVIQGLSDADIIQITYRDDPGAVQSTQSYTVPVAGTTLSALTAWFVDAARPWYNKKEVQFISIQLSRNTSNSQGFIRMNDLRVDMYVKSSMKLQNRSLTGTNDSTEEVDNVPLYGKSYSGSGNSLILKKMNINQTANQVVTTAENIYGGLIGNGDLSNHMKEPPQARDCVNCKYQGKIHLDPGYIKTSVLTAKHSQSFNTFFSNMVSYFDLVDAKRVKRFGKFRVFALEKMIDVGSADNIKVAVEINNEYSCRIKSVGKSVVVKEFAKGLIV